MSKAKSIGLIVLAGLITIEGLLYIFGADLFRIDERFLENFEHDVYLSSIYPSDGFEKQMLQLMGLTFVVGILVVLALPKNKKE
ncbi:hypothetical protein [Paenibacillus xylanexedens]|uniref:hypothetical protein n=1 Tax=Paenibacillus xylanexedens TaxID=528191 RepID=UPI000F54A52E|nr:hypothetical protein [Paenibacillus xylanexedens]RPK31774.1 hypothetical protein EDO6_02401 [Paenibacillus xylanexedens]